MPTGEPDQHPPAPPRPPVRSLPPVLLVVNPASGRGRADALAARFTAALAAGGVAFRVMTLARGPAGPDAFPAAVPAAARAIVAIGGDGTAAAAAPVAASLNAPLYHAPAGNENLLARHWRMTADPARLLAALAHGRVARPDALVLEAPNAPPSLALLMVSLGPDASVIHRLDRAPRRRTGHAAYTGPIAAELAHLATPRVRIEVDGRELSPAARGLIVVAAHPVYALGLNPAHRADPTDGLLDIAVIPFTSSPAALLRLAAWRLLRERVGHRWPRAQGRRITLTALDAAPVQADGESRGSLAPGQSLAVECRPAAFPLLMP